MKTRGIFLTSGDNVLVSTNAFKKYRLSANHGVVTCATPNSEKLVSVKIGNDQFSTDLHALSLTKVPK